MKRSACQSIDFVWLAEFWFAYYYLSSSLQAKVFPDAVFTFNLDAFRGRSVYITIFVDSNTYGYLVLVTFYQPSFLVIIVPFNLSCTIYDVQSTTECQINCTDIIHLFIDVTSAQDNSVFFIYESRFVNINCEF